MANADHYEECPAAKADDNHCHCEGINQADANYWAEDEAEAEAARWPRT